MHKTAHTSDSRPWESLYSSLSAEPSNRWKGNRLIASFVEAYPRERTQGIVGPEPDYSFRFAKIPNDEFGRRGHFPTYKLLRELIQPHSLANSRAVGLRYMPCEHASLSTVFMDDKGIRAWTRFANKFGVRFNGKRGYHFPPKRVWNTSVDCINYITSVGRSPVHKRSPEAAKRRAANRVFRGRPEPSPFQKEIPVAYRNELSAKELRSRWMRSKCPWSVAKANVKKTLQPTLVGSRMQLPEICIKSLNLIYSRVRYEPIMPGLNPARIREARTSVLEAQGVKVGNLSYPKVDYIGQKIRKIQWSLATLRDDMEVATSVRWFNLNQIYRDLESQLSRLTDNG